MESLLLTLHLFAAPLDVPAGLSLVPGLSSEAEPVAPDLAPAPVTAELHVGRRFAGAALGSALGNAVVGTVAVVVLAVAAASGQSGDLSGVEKGALALAITAAVAPPLLAVPLARAFGGTGGGWGRAFLTQLAVVVATAIIANTGGSDDAAILVYTIGSLGIMPYVVARAGP